MNGGTRFTPREHDLVEEWRGFAYAIADDYFLPGAEPADLRQEALIGLLEGLRDFDAGRGVPLGGFLALTIRRKCITAVKAATRIKHRQLTSSMRHVELEDETVDAYAAIADPKADPHRQLIARENLADLHDRLRGYSPLERRSIVGLAVGLSYAEIAGTPPGRKPKIVDNAIQRARAKLAASLDLEEAA